MGTVKADLLQASSGSGPILGNPLGWKHVAVSGNTTLTSSDGYNSVLVTTSTSNIVINLPSVSANTGRLIHIQKADSGLGTVVITPASGTIFGASTYTLYSQYASIILMSDGTNWIPLAQSYYTSTWTPTVTVAGNASGSTTVRKAWFSVRNEIVEFWLDCSIVCTAVADSSVYLTLPVQPINAFPSGATYRAWGATSNPGGSAIAWSCSSEFVSSASRIHLRSAAPTNGTETVVATGAYSIIT